MARGKNPCKKCEVGAANRPGGLCHACWVELGQPEAPKVEAPPKAPLTDDRVDDYEAMLHVWEDKPVRTYQQQGFKKLLGEKGGRAAFWDRMQRLRNKDGDGGSGEFGAASPTGVIPPWSGKGPCPTCHREAEPELDDPASARLDEMDRGELEALLAFQRNRPAFEAWQAERLPSSSPSGPAVPR